MKKITVFVLCAAAMAAPQLCLAGNRIADDFAQACRELDSLIYERTSVTGELQIKAVMKRGRTLDFYFTNSLSDLPWKYGDSEWFRKELESRFPEQYKGYRLGRISSRGEKIENLETGSLHSGGEPVTASYRLKNHTVPGRSIVERSGDQAYPDGLDGRHIALWQSHGLYYNNSEGIWKWQRPCLFQTVEDLFTQSFVLPFLVPMLENAGAYVFLPRERDLQTCEIIIDNDPDFRTDSSLVPTAAADGRMRLAGDFSETGPWKDAGAGFADAKMYYGGTDNPFTMGSARMADCIPGGKDPDKLAETVWTPDIPKRGEYAVYVSYKSLPNSTSAAHYTVRHLGGTSEFYVDQRMGGGMWIYLGTFCFAPGCGGYVALDNVVPFADKGRGRVVSADAVKIGGGYGNIARGIEGDPVYHPVISGMPRFTEGARYWLQWSGADSTLFSQNESENDYADDFMCRGDWSAYLSGGSKMNPDQEGKNIPIDLTFALHSDAGTTPNDSTVGTLAIYTLKSENARRLPTGEDRRTSREFADMVQSQIVADIRSGFDPQWNRRFLWDRGYRESRTPASPSMLCELLSHQNFADMKLGLDPAFRFTVSRAIYKGMLKYLSNRYGCSYAVQPLPVNSFSVTFHQDRIRLKWKETTDRAEPTAAASGFIIQTRIDDGVFDEGLKIEAASAVITDEGCGAGSDSERTFACEVPFEPGHVYSFRVIACNSGGRSFPSEILSAGTPLLPGHLNQETSTAPECPSEETFRTDSCILVVNNFDRVSAPAWFDGEEYAGFDNRSDSGVPYMREIAFTGEMYQNRRCLPWESDFCPGFGASWNNMSGKVIAGNTFDYPAVHGKAIMNAGYPFCSSSARAFEDDPEVCMGKWCTDLICGKQVTVKTGSGRTDDRYRVFTPGLRKRIEEYTGKGGNILVSGAYIGTDIWSSVYPVEVDSTVRKESIGFAEKVLGFRYVTSHAGRTGDVVSVPGKFHPEGLEAGRRLAFNNRPDSRLYSVESPDGITPADTCGSVFLRYCDTKVPAGVCTDSGTYRSICIGFPIEVLTDENDISGLMKASLGFLKEPATANDGLNE